MHSLTCICGHRDFHLQDGSHRALSIPSYVAYLDACLSCRLMWYGRVCTQIRVGPKSQPEQICIGMDFDVPKIYGEKKKKKRKHVFETNSNSWMSINFRRHFKGSGLMIGWAF